MKTLIPAPILLLLALGVSSPPAVAQGIPDNIPDKPGESPADRALEWQEERFRGFLSRVFTTGSLDLAPFPGRGFGYQATASLGLMVGTDDAVFLTFSARDLPTEAEISADPIEPGRRAERFFGAGYALGGTHLLGEASSLGQRSTLNLGVGVLTGEMSVLAFEVMPTYDLLVRDNWSVPAGVRLNIATVGNEVGSVTRAYMGLSLGVRWHWGQRERLELK